MNNECFDGMDDRMDLLLGWEVYEFITLYPRWLLLILTRTASVSPGSPTYYPGDMIKWTKCLLLRLTIANKSINDLPLSLSPLSTVAVYGA